MTEIQGIKSDLARLSNVETNLASLTNLITEMSARDRFTHSPLQETGGSGRSSRSPQKRNNINRTCFRCQSPDHLVRDCPQERPADTSGQTGAGATPPGSPRQVHFHASTRDNRSK